MRSGEARVWAQILESVDFKVKGKYEKSAEDTYVIKKSSLAVRRAISQLHLISDAIRKASQRDHDLKASKFVEKDSQRNEVGSVFETFAQGITKARHSAANDFLIDHLS